MSRLNLRGGFGIPGAVSAPLTSTGFGVPFIATPLSVVQRQISYDVGLDEINYQIDGELLPEYAGLSFSDKSELKRQAYEIYFKRLDDTLSQNLNLGRSKDELRAIITAKQAGLKNDDLEALYRKHNLLETFNEAIGGYGVPAVVAAKTFIDKQINFDTELSIINKQIEEGQLPELQNLTFSEKTALKTFAYDLYLQKVDKMVDDARNAGRNEIEQRAIIDTRKSNLKDADYQALYNKYNLTPPAGSPILDLKAYAAEQIKISEETAAQIKIAQNPDDFNPTRPGKIGKIGVLEAVFPIANKYGFTNVMQEYQAKKEMLEEEKKQKVDRLLSNVTDAAMFAMTVIL